MTADDGGIDSNRMGSHLAMNHSSGDGDSTRRTAKHADRTSGVPAPLEKWRRRGFANQSGAKTRVHILLITAEPDFEGEQISVTEASVRWRKVIDQLELKWADASYRKGDTDGELDDVFYSEVADELIRVPYRSNGGSVLVLLEPSGVVDRMFEFVERNPAINRRHLLQALRTRSQKPIYASRGRPKSSSGDVVISEAVNVRLTQGQVAVIDALAASVGVNRADWIRAAIAKAAEEADSPLPDAENLLTGRRPRSDSRVAARLRDD